MRSFLASARTTLVQRTRRARTHRNDASPVRDAALRRVALRNARAGRGDRTIAC